MKSSARFAKHRVTVKLYGIVWHSEAARSNRIPMKVCPEKNEKQLLKSPARLCGHFAHESEAVVLPVLFFPSILFRVPLVCLSLL